MKCHEFIKQVLKTYEMAKLQGSALSLYDRAVDYVLDGDMAVSVYNFQNFEVALDDGTVTVSTDNSFTVRPK